MNTIAKEHYIQFNGYDINGEYKVEIQRDCSQVRVETGDSDAYIDTNYTELKAIRDAITEVLTNYEKRRAKKD